jgi:hypothetical protein
MMPSSEAVVHCFGACCHVGSTTPCKDDSTRFAQLWKVHPLALCTRPPICSPTLPPSSAHLSTLGSVCYT